MAKVRVPMSGGGDKKLPQAEIDKQNKFARDFAARKNLIIASEAHVGNQGAKFVDQSGKEVSNDKSALPPNTITDIRKVPSYVKDLKINSENNIPYYVDESTGDIQHVHPDIARSSRFNPNRGKPTEGLLAYAKK